MSARTEPLGVKLCMTIHNNDPNLEDLREAAAVLRENHFWGIEPDIRDPSKIDARELASIVSDNGLHIGAIATGRGYGLDGLSLSSPDTEVRKRSIERIRDHVELACELETNVIIGLMRGRRDEQDPTALCTERLKESVGTCGSYAAERGCLIFFEAINRKETNIANSASETAELVATTGDAVRLLMDTYHLDIEEGSPVAAIEKYIHLLGHFHLADRNRGIPGTAGIDFPMIVNALCDLGYQEAMTVEIPLKPDAPTCIRRTIENLNLMGIYSVLQT